MCAYFSIYIIYDNRSIVKPSGAYCAAGGYSNHFIRDCALMNGQTQGKKYGARRKAHILTSARKSDTLITKDENRSVFRGMEDASVFHTILKVIRPYFIRTASIDRPSSCSFP